MSYDSIDGKFICSACGRISLTRQSITSHFYVAHTERGKDSHRRAGRKPGLPAWNKGLTKETDERVKLNSHSVSKSLYGKPGHPVSEETKQRISKALSGNNHGGRCAWYVVNGIKVQGTWEQRFALKMSELGIKWEKVKKHAWKYVMNGKTRHYTPDFYLPEHNLYIEIKGFWWGDDKQKMECVIKQHTDKKIIILMKEELEKVLRGELVW